jgi:hypothetical protein
LDIHKFFIKECNTTMCSDLDNWSIYNYIIYYIYIIVEQITLFFIGFIYTMKSSFFKNKYNNIVPIIERTIKCFLKTQCF